MNAKTDTPLTEALLARHEAETRALDNRFPEHGNIATRHEWRDHSMRQAKELLEHARAMEKRSAYVAESEIRDDEARQIMRALDAYEHASDYGPPITERINARQAYAKANPLGGPARVFEAMAARIRAGEDYYAVLDDYGFMVKPDHEDLQGNQ